MNLSDKDARAVDAALDPTTVTPFGDAGELAGRVARVDAMLKLLDHMPADEPADDLVSRTMARVTAIRGESARPTILAPAVAATRPRTPAVGESLQMSPAPGGEENAGGA